MAKLTLQDAETLAQKGRPWTFRMEFHGITPLGGVSSKYWFSTGRGLLESCEIGWGAVGAKPQLDLIDWAELRVRVADKLGKGYTYVQTPFIRMSQESLTKLSGTPTPFTPIAIATPVTTAVPPPPRQVIQHTPSAVQAALGKPHSQVCALKLARKGSQATGFQALDANGDYLFDFPLSEGREFARDHNLDILFV